MKKIMSIVLIILAVVITPFIALDGSFLPKKYNGKLNDEKEESIENDVYRILNYAIGASSSHNMQPWLVKVIDDNTVELYADMDKQLQVIDSNNKQLLMSQGTFIEKFKQGAMIYGYDTEWEYAQIDLSNDEPLIATANLIKVSDLEVDTVSSSTVNANGIYTDDDLDKVLNDSMNDYYGFDYEHISLDKEMESLQSVLLQATIIESRDKAAMDELLKIFRWTEWDKNEYRYGLSLNSLPSLLKPFVQPIMKLSSKDIEGFGDSSIKMFEDRIENDIGYILIKKDSPSSIDYVKIGEIYQSLMKNAGNYSLRPAVQVLQDFEAISQLGNEFQNMYGEDGEVLIIISVQTKSGEKTPSNPRHMVEDILYQ